MIELKIREEKDNVIIYTSFTLPVTPAREELVFVNRLTKATIREIDNPVMALFVMFIYSRIPTRGVTIGYTLYHRLRNSSKYGKN